MFTSPDNNKTTASSSQDTNTTVQLPISNPPSVSTYSTGAVRIDLEQFKKEKQEILKAIDEDNLQKLLKIRPDITKEYRLSLCTNPSEYIEMTILFYAGTFKKNKIVAYFMQDTSNLLSKKQKTILKLIKNRENDNFFSLPKNTDFYFFDKDFNSPLYHAINTNNKEITKSLIITAPALLNLYIHGAPPLMYAVGKGYVELATVMYAHKKSALLKRDHHGNLGVLRYAVNSKSSKMVEFIVQLLEEWTQQESSKYTKMQIIQLLEEQSIQENSIYTKLQFEADLLKAQEILNSDIRNSENHFARMRKALRNYSIPQIIQGNQNSQRNITILTSSSELLRQNSSHSETSRAPVSPKTPLSPFSANSHHLRNSSSSMMNSQELGLNRSSQEIDNPTLQAPTNSPQQRPVDSPSSSLENLSLQFEIDRLQRELKQAYERIQLLEQGNLKPIDESSILPMTPQFNNINATSTSNAKDTSAQQHQIIKSSYKNRQKSTSLMNGLGGIYNNIKGALSPSNANKN